MLTEGKMKGGNGYVKSSSGSKKPTAPPPPLIKRGTTMTEKYIVFHLTETDGDVCYCEGSLKELKEYCKDMGLSIDDCTLVNGEVVNKILLK